MLWAAQRQSSQQKDSEPSLHQQHAFFLTSTLSCFSCRSLHISTHVYVYDVYVYDIISIYHQVTQVIQSGCLPDNEIARTFWVCTRSSGCCSIIWWYHLTHVNQSADTAGKSPTTARFFKAGEWHVCSSCTCFVMLAETLSHFSPQNTWTSTSQNYEMLRPYIYMHACLQAKMTYSGKLLAQSIRSKLLPLSVLCSRCKMSKSESTCVAQNRHLHATSLFIFNAQCWIPM